MKWIEFTICVLIDLCLLSYFIASFTEYAVPTSTFPKVVYATLCCLASIASTIVYIEARKEK